MSPVASSTDEHSVARLSSSNAAVGASKKSPSGRLTSPAAYVFAPSWMSNSKESNKSSNLAFSSFSATNSPTAISPQQRAVQGKYRNPSPRSSNSSPYPGRPPYKLPSNKLLHNDNVTTTTTTVATNTATLPALPSITTTSRVKKPTSLHRSTPSNASSTSSSLQDSEFPTLVEETIPDKRHDSGRSAWGNPNAIKAKVFCPPTTETDENNEEMNMSSYDIELERLKALVPKRNSGSSVSTASTTVTTSKRNSHHHHHHYHHHHNNNSNNNNSHNNNNNNNNNNSNNSNNNSHHYHHHHHHHPPSPLVSPTPSRSLSSSQRMRFNNNNKSSRTTTNSNNSYSYSNNNGNNGNNMNSNNMRTSPLTKVPLQISLRETSGATSAVVKLPTTAAVPSTSASSVTSSRPKRTSSSGSSISSFHSQPTSVCDQRLEPPPYRICELTDDTTTTSSSSFLESPRTLIEEDMMEEGIVEEDDEGEEKTKDVIEVRVNDHEREHFLSWVRTWACRPAAKASNTSMEAINPRFFGSCGEYSYFGPLGTNAATISK